MLSKASITARNHLARSFYMQSGLRQFAVAPQECLDNLKKLGITNKNVVYNPR